MPGNKRVTRSMGRLPNQRHKSLRTQVTAGRQPNTPVTRGVLLSTRSLVMLSEAATKRSEVAAQSKHPYLESTFATKLKSTNPQLMPQREPGVSPSEPPFPIPSESQPTRSGDLHFPDPNQDPPYRETRLLHPS